ncbi:unnamed protein product [Polarella glacialis]|uniref:Uncharacterized protein n=1 Tax=Polarella glacialis TaxID=89957 RepID=A0A813HT62_POLGL|nr:unnamed protein product [Polarella glacialis]
MANVELLEAAAASGHAEAQYALGTSYLMGDGVAQDAKRAVDLFQLSAMQGDPRAQCNLGAMYAQGIGVEQDYAEAKRCYEQSADQGNADGQYNLALVYAQGLGGCEKEMLKATSLCAKAAAQGQVQAEALLPSLQAQLDSGSGRGASLAPLAHNDRHGKASPEMVQGAGDAAASEAKSQATHPMDHSAQGIHFKKVAFGSSKQLHLRGKSDTLWTGEQVEASFPKPGTEESWRKLFLLRSFATQEEVAGILRIAQTALEFNVDNDSVDQRPTYERNVIQVGQYIHPEMEVILRPLIEDRLLPFVRERFAAPGAVVCTALVRRYLPEERRTHPTHLDGHAFCTAVLGLNADEFEGGLYAGAEHVLDVDSCVETWLFTNMICLTEFAFLVADAGLHPELCHECYAVAADYSCWVAMLIQSFTWTDANALSMFRSNWCRLQASLQTHFLPLERQTNLNQAASLAGDADAMTALAQKLDRGMNKEGVGSDPEKAAGLFLRAAKMGHSEAMINLGLMYQTGRGGLPVDGTEDRFVDRPHRFLLHAHAPSRYEHGMCFPEYIEGRVEMCCAESVGCMPIDSGKST